MIRNALGRRALLLAAAVLATSCSMMPASNTVSLGGKLSGANQVPAVMADGSGTAEVTLNKGTNLLTWKVTYSGLSGPARAAHFHGPATTAQSVGVILGFTGSVESPIQGQATVTAAQAADILAGKWYVNVHTAKNPGGEIRAQIVPAM